MAYKVIANFRDKETKKRYEKGDPYKNENKERVAFLIKRGFIEEVKEEKKAKKTTKK